jgi:DNA sulfur modification protein DndC
LLKKYNCKFNSYSISIDQLKNIKLAKQYYKENLNKIEIKKEFDISTLKRFAIQNIINPDKVENKFFPSKEEEKYIRKEWKEQKNIKTNENFISIYKFL